MRLVRSDTRDVADLAALLVRFNLEYECPVPTTEWLAGRLTQLLASGETVALVAEPAGDVTGRSPVGLAVLRFRPGLWSAGQECELAELYVVGEHRRQGLGRALLRASLAAAAARGADRVYLGTESGDTDAHRLYESFGFSKYGDAHGVEVSYWYEKDLPPDAD